VLSRANVPQIFRKRVGLFHDYVRQSIGHHMTRIELCSARSRLSLRSTLQAPALTAPAAARGRTYVMAEEARRIVSY
jgi:hypothetical protein